MTFYDGRQFPAKYRGGAFIAFHGSWNRAPRPQKGYNVTFVPFDEKGMPRGTYEVFADGFAGKDEFTVPREARFRPGGVAVGPDGSLYVTDTEKGRVWRIFYTGEAARAAAASAPAPAAPAAPAARAAQPAAAKTAAGQEMYQRVCAVCHMVDGTGVAGMQPPLVGDKVVAGLPATMIRVVLFGPKNVLPANRPRLGSNEMPPFDALTDKEIADLLTYVRREFAKKPGTITPAQVAAQRAKKP
jgi:mono/diheme cytochrome c family protein